MTNQPDPADIGDAYKHLAEYLTRIGHTMTVQAALGHLIRGHHIAARTSLERLPTNVLDTVATAASALAIHAHEIATNRPTPADDAPTGRSGVPRDIAHPCGGAS